MTIIATAPMPVNGSDLRAVDTFELPKQDTVRNGAGGEPGRPPLPCPSFCVEHSVGTPGFPADRTTTHESAVTTVDTVFSSGPADSTVDRHEVRVWAERFDCDRPADGHPVAGTPAVHMSVDGYDSTGMTADQAEQVGRALLAGAQAVRAASSTDEWAGAHEAPGNTWTGWRERVRAAAVRWAMARRRRGKYRICCHIGPNGEGVDQMCDRCLAHHARFNRMCDTARSPKQLARRLARDCRGVLWGTGLYLVWSAYRRDCQTAARIFLNPC